MRLPVGTVEEVHQEGWENIQNEYEYGWTEGRIKEKTKWKKEKKR